VTWLLPELDVGVDVGVLSPDDDEPLDELELEPEPPVADVP
jgi:hypothetical protein